MRWITMMVAALAALTLAQPGMAGEYYGHQKVVYHIDLPGGPGEQYYLSALAYMRNQIAAVGRDDIEVKVVMHADGIGLVQDARTDQKLQMAIMALKGDKVAFLVCNNTIQARKLDPDKDLFDVHKEDIVPSGAAEVSRLQQQGFTYFKP